MYQQFIIAYGWDSEVEIIEAISLKEALAEATCRSLKEGLLDDDLADTTWAEPYSEDLAHDVGLLPLDEMRDWRRDHWRAQAPWRS